MPYSDGAQIGDELPVGALIMEDQRIFKVTRPLEKDASKILKQIANFEIDCLAYGTPLNSTVHQYLININQRLTVDTLDFTSTLAAFKNYIRPFYFKGDANDLESIVSMMSQNLDVHSANPESENLIVIKDFVGFYETKDKSLSFWIFEDRIIISHKASEKIKTPQIVPFGTQKVLKIDNKWLFVDNSFINKSLIPTYSHPDDYNLAQFLKEWQMQLKNPTITYSLLGWIISSFFLQKVNKLRKVKNFPFYVLTSGTEVGKTAFLSNCVNLWGCAYVGENFAQAVTPYVEMVEFSRVSNLPIWRDEYKNENYALKKEGILRSVYTRSANSKGTNDKRKTEPLETRATLLLSGEDITEDPALSRRMIKMRLNRNDKVTKEEHENNSVIALQNFPKAFPLIISADFDEQTFLKIYQNNHIPGDTTLKDELMCYASLGAIFGEEVATEAIEQSKDYHARTKNDLINQTYATAEDFFAMIDGYCIEKGWYESLYNAKPKVLDYFYSLKLKDTIYFKFAALHQLFTKNKPKDDYKWSKKALGQLIQEAYNAKEEPRNFHGEAARVMIVDRISAVTDVAGDLFHKIVDIQEKWEIKQNSGYEQNLPDL